MAVVPPFIMKGKKYMFLLGLIIGSLSGISLMCIMRVAAHEGIR